MHLEFRLPSGAGGQSALYSCSTLHRELDRWHSLYGFEYTTTVTYYKLTVEFKDEQAYTWFALSWRVPQLKWEICDD